MEPAVQYVISADGTRIAYTTTGSGPSVLLASDPVVSHVQLEWQEPTVGTVCRRLSERSRLIRFDQRGSGLSDRNPADISLEAHVADLAAVADRAGSDTFALASVQRASLAAIAYAARHPGRVSRLVLVDAFARRADIHSGAAGQMIRTLMAADWRVFTETGASLVFGYGRDEAQSCGAYIRECIAQDFLLRSTAAPEDDDVTEALGELQMPVLVLHHSGIRFMSIELGKELAARIPDARLVIIDGAWCDHVEGLADRITEFAHPEMGPVPAPDPPQVQGGLRAILFTDLVGHTEMMQRLGDEGGRDVLREHERITRQTLKQHGGAEVKTMGDGFMASFGSATAAMECAVALQRAFAAWNDERGAAEATQLRVRVGLNAGEPIEEEGDLFGAAVILASRIAAKADAGEILIPEPVRHLLAGKGFVFADRGEFMAKGFDDAVRLYEVRWRE
jgi:class 3 adenylate cyclase/pimeloyl-ACP methyl ester carboxylesterase